MNTKPFEALIKLLQQEQVIYEELAQLLEIERQALLSMEADQVGQIVSRKQTLALRVKTLDESRKMLSRRLGTLCGLRFEQVTTTQLAKCAPAGVGERLRRAARDLRGVVEHCQQVNKYNDGAARKAVDLLGGAIEYMIQQADPVGQVYTPGKRAQSGGSSSGAGKSTGGPGLISRTA